MKANNKGVALLIAIFSLGLMVFIAMEVSYETNVEYVVAAQKVNRLKAHYAAKAGVELSLLRILLYKKAIASFGEQLGENKSMLDPIWNFPFAWPPTQFIPQGDLSSAAKDQMKKVEKESTMDTTYITTIESESSKIDVNDLGSNIEALRVATQKQLIDIFTREVENNEDFNAKYRNEKFDELINNMTDWVDEDRESLNGGDESAKYDELMKQTTSDFIPPNQPFKTMNELHMVAGMKDDFFKLLEKYITVYGTKGINVNYASSDILKALDEKIDDKIAAEIIKRRSDPNEGGLFKDQDDFLNYLDTLISTANFNKAQIPLLFDAVYNFKIKSTGEFAKSSNEITVITFDVENLTQRVADLLDAQDKEKDKGGSEESGEETKAPDGEQPDKDPDEKKKETKSKDKKIIPQGRPRIVYWQET